MGGKSEKVPVDMGALLGLRLCFSDDGCRGTDGVLIDVDQSEAAPYAKAGSKWWKMCRPIPGHWVYHRNLDDIAVLCAKLSEAGFTYLVDLTGPKIRAIGGIQPDGKHCWPEDAHEH